jgi:hypothetical protein
MQAASITLLPDKLDGPLPDVVQSVPSMMSVKERKFLLALANYEYRGEGTIIDAGVFCGGSTFCFGTGVKANSRFDAIISRWGKPIRTYEYGIVNPGMIPFFKRHGVSGEWKSGDSFEAYLRNNIRPVAELVELTMGDICRANWSGEPIEIMFLDVIKSEEIQRHLLRTFFPSLTLGGVLIQQDYFIDGLPFLRIAQESLSHYFEYLGEIQSSAVFRLKSAIPREMLESNPLERLTLDEQMALLDQARDRSVDPDRRLLSDLGKVRYLTTLRMIEPAQRLLEKLPSTYPKQLGQMQLPRIKMAVRTAKNGLEAISHRPVVWRTGVNS